MRAGRDRLAELEVRALERGRDQVVHERAVQAVAGVVEGDDLHQRDPDTLGKAAVDLAFDDHRVDRHDAVVYRDQAPHLDLGRVRVDVDYRDVGAVGVGQVRRVVDRLGVEAALHAFRGRLPPVGAGGGGFAQNASF